MEGRWSHAGVGGSCRQGEPLRKGPEVGASLAHLGSSRRVDGASSSGSGVAWWLKPHNCLALLPEGPDGLLRGPLWLLCGVPEPPPHEGQGWKWGIRCRLFLPPRGQA